MQMSFSESFQHSSDQNLVYLKSLFSGVLSINLQVFYISMAPGKNTLEAALF
jgi:hypothetical protein